MERGNKPVQRNESVPRITAGVCAQPRNYLQKRVLERCSELQAYQQPTQGTQRRAERELQCVEERRMEREERQRERDQQERWRGEREVQKITTCTV